MVKKLGIVGPIGSYDIGDWALLQSNIDYFKDYFEFILFTYDVEKTRIIVDLLNLNKVEIVDISNYYKIYSISVPIIAKPIISIFNYFIYKYKIHSNNPLCKKMSEIDKLLVIGGSYFNNIWNVRYFPICFCIDIARMLNKKVIISGINVGPFSFFDMLFLRKIFHKVDIINLRSNFPPEMADLENVNIKIDDKNIMGDNATFLKVRVDQELTKKLSCGDNYVVLCLSCPIYNVDDVNGFFLELKKFLITIIERGYKILYIPMHYDLSSDYSIGLKIKREVNSNNFILLDPRIYYDPKVIKFLIINSKIVISSVLHPIVFSVGEKKPFISIIYSGKYGDVYERKILGLMGVFNILKSNSEAIIYANDLNSSQLRYLFEKYVYNFQYCEETHQENLKKREALNKLITE